MQRSRRLFLILTILVVMSGLASRSGIVDQSSFIGRYSGDTLWALMVYLVMAVLFPKASIAVLILGSLSFSFIIEISQLFKFDWLVMLRSYKLGGLILGYGFLWSDLLCYMSGIGVGAGIDKLIFKVSRR